MWEYARARNRRSLIAASVCVLAAAASTALFVGNASAVGCPPGVYPAINDTPPSITGSGTVGGTLSVSSNGTWHGGCGTTYTYTYQWYHAGDPAGLIYGATSSSYTLTAADAGATVYALVEATGGDATGTAPSNHVVVAGTAPVLGDNTSSMIDYSAYDDEIPVAINVTDGNAVVTDEDFDLPNADDVTFARTLNTLSNTATDLGAGWRQNWGYDTALGSQPDGSYVFNDASGYAEQFTPNGSGGYTAADSDFGTLTEASGTGTVATSGGDAFLFDSTGTLTGYDDYNGGDFTLNYTTTGFANPEKLLTGITDPSGTTTSLSYTPEFGSQITGPTWFLTQVTDPSGNTYTYGYDSTGRLTSVANSASGLTTTISYTNGYQPEQISVSDGHVTDFTYDSQGRITKVEQIDPSSSSDVTTNVAYGPPTDSSCTSNDVGETTVTGGQDGEDQVYCYTASGTVTNYNPGD